MEHRYTNVSASYRTVDGSVVNVSIASGHLLTIVTCIIDEISVFTSTVYVCYVCTYVRTYVLACVGVEFSDAYFNQTSFLEYNPLALNLERWVSGAYVRGTLCRLSITQWGAVTQ